MQELFAGMRWVELAGFPQHCAPCGNFLWQVLQLRHCIATAQHANSTLDYLEDFEVQQGMASERVSNTTCACTFAWKAQKPRGHEFCWLGPHGICCS